MQQDCSKLADMHTLHNLQSAQLLLFTASSDKAWAKQLYLCSCAAAASDCI